MSEVLEPSTVFRRSARQVSCDLNGEAAILHLDQSVYFGLKGVGAHVWMALEKPQSFAELNRAVCKEFDVDAAQAKADLMKFLSELQTAGLVERVEG
ncbi:MAG: PqqD family protein [Proteobacteria bacterium]|nr:PqqD family protein [Pseudomonadota bacterium]